MTNWLTDWLTDWQTDWLTDWLTDGRMYWLTAKLTDWLIDWLIDWLVDWLVETRHTDWWIDYFIHWLRERCINRCGGGFRTSCEMGAASIKGGVRIENISKMKIKGPTFDQGCSLFDKKFFLRVFYWQKGWKTPHQGTLSLDPRSTALHCFISSQIPLFLQFLIPSLFVLWLYLLFQLLKVSCRVKTRYVSGKDWTMYQRSKDFFAGIKVKAKTTVFINFECWK